MKERNNNRAKSIGSGTKMRLGSQKLPADPLLLDGIGRVTLSNLKEIKKSDKDSLNITSNLNGVSKKQKKKKRVPTRMIL